MPYIIIILSIIFLLPENPYAIPASYQPGFKTVASFRGEQGMRIDANVWYPTNRASQPLHYVSWTIQGALNAKPAPGQFPLLVISHPSSGTRFSYHNLAEFLSTKGFIIVAPTHSHDYLDNMDDLYTWKQLQRRVSEISESISLLFGDKELSPCIDKERIGIIGFGPGGTAALLLGGALPNCVNWSSYCDKSGKDIYCRAKTRDKINEMCKLFPLKNSLANPRIKAVAVIAPAYGMLFDAESFQYFYPPLLLVSAGNDNYNKPEFHCEPLARILGKRARYLEMPLADTGALMAPCPQGLRTELPELCLSVSDEDRSRLHDTLRENLYTFFSYYLLSPQNLPVIPLPPQLNAAPEKQLETPKKEKAKKPSRIASPKRKAR